MSPSYDKTGPREQARTGALERPCGPCSGKGTAWDLLAFIGRVDPGDRQAMYKVRVQYGLTDSNGNGNQLPRNNGTGRIVATYFY